MPCLWNNDWFVQVGGYRSRVVRMLAVGNVVRCGCDRDEIVVRRQVEGHPSVYLLRYAVLGGAL